MTLHIALLWQRFGPVHDARLAETRALLATLGATVSAIEIASRTSTYDWELNPHHEARFFTLLPGSEAETAPPLQVYLRLLNLLSQERINVLFVPSYWPASSLACLLAAKTLGIRTVMMNDSHRTTGRNSGPVYWIKKALIRLFDAALVAGSLHQQFFAELGLPADRIFDGYDTVENEHFARIADQSRQAPAACRAERRLPERFFLSLGRFVPKKNLDLVLEAYAHLVRAGQHARHALVFVGSGPLQAHLETRARSLQLPVFHPTRPTPEGDSSIPPDATPSGAAVCFYPFAQIDSVPHYYALATAFILASTTEEWGLVVNEAMAASCPVLVSQRVGSAPDLVLDGVTGYRFNPEDPASLTPHLARLAADPELARTLGRQAAQHIGLWSNRRFAENALRAAQKALESPSLRP